MKKKNIINLIKYYSEKNDIGFRSEAYEIAKDFDESGDYQLSEYIMACIIYHHNRAEQKNNCRNNTADNRISCITVCMCFIRLLFAFLLKKIRDSDTCCITYIVDSIGNNCNTSGKDSADNLKNSKAEIEYKCY